MARTSESTGVRSINYGSGTPNPSSRTLALGQLLPQLAMLSVAAERRLQRLQEIFTEPTPSRDRQLRIIG